MGYGTKIFLAGIFVGSLTTMILGYLLIRYDEYKDKKKRGVRKYEIDENVLGTLDNKEKVQQVESKVGIKERRIGKQNNSNEHTKKNTRQTKRNVGKNI